MANPYWQSTTARLYLGDVTGCLRELPADSIHCVVTSPPYWGLRDYGVAGQLGLEPLADCLGWATGKPCGECFICHMVAVFREVRRVLRPDGVCWLNMGDKAAADEERNRLGINGGIVADDPKKAAIRETGRRQRQERGIPRPGTEGLLRGQGTGGRGC